MIKSIHDKSNYLFARIRICGDTASDRNIHSSVSEQLKKNFAKSKWKVRSLSLSPYIPPTLSLCRLIYGSISCL